MDWNVHLSSFLLICCLMHFHCFVGNYWECLCRCVLALLKCYSNPCEEGGTCHEDPPNKSYKCTCLPAFTGKRCESGQYHNTSELCCCIAVDYCSNKICPQLGIIHCVQKKHPLTFSFISPWIICGFKRKLHWIYPRIDRFWQCKNYIFIAIDDVIMTSHLSG